MNKKPDFEKNRRYMIRISAFDNEGNEIAFDEKFIKGSMNKVYYQKKVALL